MLYLEGIIKVVSKKSFTDKAGKVVDYFDLHVMDDKGELLMLRSGKDFSQMEGKPAVLSIVTQGTDKPCVYKLKVSDAKSI